MSKADKYADDIREIRLKLEDVHERIKADYEHLSEKENRSDEQESELEELDTLLTATDGALSELP